MSVFQLVIVITLVAFIIWETWRARGARSTAMQLCSFALTFVICAAMGLIVPWHSAVPIIWWYLLVAATAAYAGTMTYNLIGRRQASGARRCARR